MAVDFDKKYRSKEVFTPKPFNNMGVNLIQVSNEYGMVSAILSESDFNNQFEVIPEEVPVAEAPTT
jgi:hypothetical protein